MMLSYCCPLFYDLDVWTVIEWTLCHSELTADLSLPAILHMSTRPQHSFNKQNPYLKENNETNVSKQVNKTCNSYSTVIKALMHCMH